MRGIRSVRAFEAAWVAGVLTIASVVLGFPEKAHAVCWAAFGCDGQPPTYCATSCNSQCSSGPIGCELYGSSGEYRCKCN